MNEINSIEELLLACKRYIDSEEELNTIDENGNILDFTLAHVVYGPTIYGELIKINHKYKYTSSENDKKNIIPKLEIIENEDGKDTLYRVLYVRLEEAYNSLGEELFDITNNGHLVPIKLETPFGTIEIDDREEYKSTTIINNKEYSVEGTCNFPLSGDTFGFNEYKENISFAMNPYFRNIYDTQIAGLVFLTDNSIKLVQIGQECTIEYEHDEYGVIKEQKYHLANNPNPENYCNYNISELPNGNTIIESSILAEPVFPINKKSIFYRTIEVDKDKKIVSDYRALIVNQKNYN